MRTTVSGLAALSLAVLGLTGCGGGGSTEEFCGLDDKLTLSASSNFEDLDSALDDAVDAAPDEIKDDVETVRATFDEAFGQLREQGVSDLSAVTPEQGQALQELNTEEFQQASSNIEAFVADNCGSSSGG